MRFLAQLLLVLFCGFISAADFYVSPSGKPHPSGHGTIDNPWSLPEAIGHGKLAQPAFLKSGDTIYLRGGTYRYAQLRSHLVGVTLRSYPGEWAVVDLNDPAVSEKFIEFKGSGATYRDFEITNSSSASRISNERTPWPLGHVARGRVATYGNNIRKIGIIGHETQGFGMDNTEGGLHADCIFYNCGWMGGDRSHGHGDYQQNRTGTKRTETEVTWGNYGCGIHAYAQNGALNGLQFVGCTSFLNGGQCHGLPLDHREIIVGGETPVNDLIIDRVCTFGQAFDLGYPWGNARNGNASVTNCIVGKSSLRDLSGRWSSLTLSGNIQNTIPDIVRVEPSRHTPGRAVVTVYNGRKAPSVSLNLADVLPFGSPYEIRNVTRLKEVFTSGTYSGPISLPMQSTATIPAMGSNVSVVIGPEFGCFIVSATPMFQGVTDPTPQPLPEPIPPPKPEPIPETPDTTKPPIPELPPVPIPEPPKPPSPGTIVGEFTFFLHPITSRPDNLVITKGGKHVYTFWRVKQHSFDGKWFYRLTTDGILNRSTITGGSDTRLDSGVKSFTVEDGKVTVSK